MNKRNTLVAVRTVFLLVLLLSVYLFHPRMVAADETDLYHESLKFDSNGNLLITTRDKKASSSVRYRTIGWIVKRAQTGSGARQYIRVKPEQSSESRTDPSDPNYTFNYFKCDRTLIFAKIGAVSKEWQKDLYKNGGIVYLDAIMTVVENGEALGYMDDAGILHGEVYTTAAGIMNARNWADAQALRTHYNKAVSFPPVPGLLQEEEEKEDEDRVRIRYGETECGESNVLRIQAAPAENPAFDTTKGIPTGEDVFVSGQMQKYYYSGVMKHYYGTVSVPVEIAVEYQYPVETEDGITMESYISNFTYYVSRPYSYYRIESLRLYVLDQVIVENKALPVLPLECRGLYQPHVILERDLNSYMIIPTSHASANGGDLSSGTCISSEELEQIAERAAGDVRVRNDMFVIDGETILDGSYTKIRTPEPKRQHGERLQSFRSEDMTIPHTKRNGSCDTHAVAVYREIADKQREDHLIRYVNPVVVHTPVVCKGGITDDTAHNQQVVPTQHFSLVLGRSFSVGISTVGTHKDQKGYGTRNYEKYVKRRQIRFPFEVYDGNVRYTKDTWIDLPSERKTFYLPVGVHEGDYRIRYRTIAKNESAERGGIDKNGYLANLELSEYGAYDELTVTVIGRMYDLALTDIVDYPRWRSVFYETNGSKKAFAFWIGKKNLEGDLISERVMHGVFPILPGNHPFNPTARAVGLGYRMKVQLKTIGDMRDSDDRIALIPTYYYVSRDGSRRQQVKLYRKKDLSEVYVPLILTASNRSFLPVETRNVSDPVLRTQSVQVWDGEYQLSPDLRLVDAGIDLDSYIRQRGGRIGQHDPVFLRDGYLLVQFDVRSYSSGAAHLSYVNDENNRHGYCNMWRLQGFSYDRTDCFANRFVFEDGDCLLFDTKYTLHSDYESWGTH